MLRVAFREFDKKLIVTRKTITIVDYLTTSYQNGCYDLNQYDIQEKPITPKTEDELTLQKLEHRESYYKKRQNQIVELVENNTFRCFMTVTFEDELNEEGIKYQWKLARTRLELYYKQKIKYICRIERGEENQRLHLHLLVDVPFLNNYSEFWHDKKGNKKINKRRATEEILDLIENTRNKDLKAKRERMYKEGGSLLKCIMAVGHIDIKSISCVKKAINYVTKYMTKGMSNNISKKRIVWTSSGLEKAIHITNENVLSKVEFLINSIIKNCQKDDILETYSGEYVNKLKIRFRDENFYRLIKELNIESEVKNNFEFRLSYDSTKMIETDLTKLNTKFIHIQDREYRKNLSKESKLNFLKRKHYQHRLETDINQAIIDIRFNYKNNQYFYRQEREKACTRYWNLKKAKYEIIKTRRESNVI